MSVDEHTVVLASASAVYLGAPATTPTTPVFIHGVPTSADIWIPVLERTGGVALDLPGFGRSDKGGQLDYTIAGLTAATVQLIEALALGPVSLVGHGWGAAVALATAGRVPAAKLILIEPEPTGEWSRLERAWRTRGLGEVVMGAITKRSLARSLRGRARTEQAWPDDAVTTVWEQFDQGTQRAILRLYRSTELPALSVQSETDTLVMLGERTKSPIAAARIETIPGAGHWPWLDRPECIATIADFLAGP